LLQQDDDIRGKGEEEERRKLGSDACDPTGQGDFDWDSLGLI
jgi:hypothetical protein